MKTVFHNEEIQENLERTAELIDDYYQNREPEKPVLSVPVLNGGLFFYVDLVRELSIKTEMGIISTNYYGEAEKPLDDLKFRYQEMNVEGRHVLLVDEICFTGTTLDGIKRRLLEQGAVDVKTCTLVDHIREGRIHSPDFSVMTYTGNSWLFGYGMDMHGLHREVIDIVEE